MGVTCPHNLEAVEAPPPQLWIVIVVHFYFCLFLHVNLGLPENSGPNPGSFLLVLSRGYLGPRETFALPPTSKKFPCP